MSNNDSYAVGGSSSIGGGSGGGDQQLKLTFDLSGYKPEDVNVKVNNNVLKGRHCPHEACIHSRRMNIVVVVVVSSSSRA